MGVRTDEAKYLLDIPYPHPPLARTILSSLDGLSGQEFFWRLVFATITVQAVWLVWDLSKDLKRLSRISLCLVWLLNTAVIGIAGSIMMSVLTALQELVLLWLLMRTHTKHTHIAALIALFWLGSLLTAYQAVLFSPLVLAALLRERTSRMRALLYFCVPLLVLFIYSLSNPLSLQSMFIHGAKNAGEALSVRLMDSLRLWAAGGSVVLSCVGTWGILRSRSWPLIATFVLTCAFILLSRIDYYAILFTPLFLAGAFVLVREQRASSTGLALLTLAFSVMLLIFRPFHAGPSVARDVLSVIVAEHQQGPILMNGTFGHEWQYESSDEIRRYNPELLTIAQAVVCLQACPEINPSEWRRMPRVSVEVWVKL